MIVSPEIVSELDAFFKSVKVPFEIDLNKAIHMTNVPAFVDKTLSDLKNPDIAERTMWPRYEDLLVIRRLLENNIKV